MQHRHKRYLRLLLPVLAVALLAGCGPQGEQIMIQNAKGTAYSTGYGDGCQSGRKDAGVQTASPKQDLNLYTNNPNYKKGWDIGFKECKFREEKVAELSRRDAAVERQQYTKSSTQPRRTSRFLNLKP